MDAAKKSPCIGCERQLMSKKTPECRDCTKRIAYAESQEIPQFPGRVNIEDIKKKGEGEQESPDFNMPDHIHPDLLKIIMEVCEKHKITLKMLLKPPTKGTSRDKRYKSIVCARAVDELGLKREILQNLFQTSGNTISRYTAQGRDILKAISRRQKKENPIKEEKPESEETQERTKEEALTEPDVMLDEDDSDLHDLLDRTVNTDVEVVLDFTGREDLLELVKEKAKLEFRSLQNQMLYMIFKQLGDLTNEITCPPRHASESKGESSET